MNYTSIFGLLAAILVLGYGVGSATDNYKIFLDAHAIAIVIGGTFAATLICFPFSTIKNLFTVFFKKIVGKFSGTHAQVIQEIVNLSQGYRDDTNYLKNNLNTIKFPFLKEAIELMTEGGIPDQKIDMILKERAGTHFKRYEEEANIFKVMGKFPPAFGLLGTTLGMIALLQTIGSPDSFKLIGPAMAIGLVATLYGIAIANLIFIPMGENLIKLNKEDQVSRKMVILGVKLIREKEHPLVVEEFLKSFILPSERNKLKKVA